jgi:hypothetical protein
MSSDYHPHFLHVTLFAFILIALLGIAIEKSERHPVQAQTTRACTDGVDCFADCITNTPGTGADVGIYASAACQAKDIPIRPHARIAEDFEAITFWKGMGPAPGKTGPGSGATACVEGNDNANCYGNTNPPLYGPPYDPTGGSPTTKRGEQLEISTLSIVHGRPQIAALPIVVPAGTNGPVKRTLVMWRGGETIALTFRVMTACDGTGVNQHGTSTFGVTSARLVQDGQ